MAMIYLSQTEAFLLDKLVQEKYHALEEDNVETIWFKKLWDKTTKARLGKDVKKQKAGKV